MQRNAASICENFHYCSQFILIVVQSNNLANPHNLQTHPYYKNHNAQIPDPRPAPRGPVQQSCRRRAVFLFLRTKVGVDECARGCSLHCSRRMLLQATDWDVKSRIWMASTRHFPAEHRRILASKGINH